MATPAQAAAATVGAGSLAAAGAYGITQAVNGSEESTPEEQTQEEVKEIPTPTTFENTETFNSGSYQGKLISFIKQANLEHLVKPENNEEWWKWAYENKYLTKKVDNQRHNLFTTVNNSETLKSACQKAYTQNKDAYKFEDDYLLENISTFCTKGTEKKDISEPKAEVWNTAQTSSEGYKSGVLSIQSNAAVLVKKDAGTTNDLWWKWAYKNLYLTTTKDIDSTFTKTTAVTTDYHQTTNTALNNVCDAAYKKNHSALKATENKLLKNIKQFCSTDRTETLLKLPEPETVTKLTKSSENYNDNKFIEKNTDKLVDPKNNQDWWKWAFENRYPTLESEKSALPKPFKEVNKAFETTTTNTLPSEENPQSLNKACQKAYSKTKQELENKTEGTPNLLPAIKRFCTPSTVTNDLSAPDNQ